MAGGWRGGAAREALRLLGSSCHALLPHWCAAPLLSCTSSARTGTNTHTPFTSTLQDESLLLAEQQQGWGGGAAAASGPAQQRAAPAAADWDASGFDGGCGDGAGGGAAAGSIWGTPAAGADGWGTAAAAAGAGPAFAWPGEGGQPAAAVEPTPAELAAEEAGGRAHAFAE